MAAIGALGPRVRGDERMCGCHSSRAVMAGYNCWQNGVASLAYVPAITSPSVMAGLVPAIHVFLIAKLHRRASPTVHVYLAAAAVTLRNPRRVQA